jgi:hypothetical protein
MSKLQLTRPSKINRVRKPFGIYTDTYDIVKKLSEESEVPMVQIMHDAIVYCLNDIEYVDPKDDYDSLTSIKWGDK